MKLIFRKKTIKNLTIFLLLISAMFSALKSPIFLYNKFALTLNNPKISGSWEIPPLIISDDPGYPDAVSWYWVRVQPWCSGTGYPGDPYIIENVTINGGGVNSCLTITHSYYEHFIIRNCNFYNSGSGMFDAGLKLELTQYGTIINNNISNNKGNGIQLSQYSVSNKVIDNIVGNNDRMGILLYDQSNNNKIQENNASYNKGCGIASVYNSNNNIILKNNAYNNTSDGIYVYESDNNLVKQNNVINNNRYGIYVFWGSEYNNIITNKITNTSLEGIYLHYYCYNNTILNNTINYNNYGLRVSIDSNENLIYLNNFTNNIVVNGKDEGENNKWDNSSIGNYWDDYLGMDIDDDGIGDFPYDIPGPSNSQDNFPIWNDGNDKPKIIINYPVSNQLFGNFSPTFEVSIPCADKDTTWYTLDNGITNTTFTETYGFIDQTLWDGISNGTVVLRFYINDTRGSIGHSEVNLRKDNMNPIILIQNPESNEVFGKTAPVVNISITEPNLDRIWYSLSNGTKIIQNQYFNNYIEQSDWDEMGNGIVIIKFYANDSLGNIGHAEVNVRKDVKGPNIKIFNPIENELYSNLAPSYNVEIIDLNLDSMWYSIDNGITNTTFSANGTINQELWEKLGSGSVIITFYANDSLGNINWAKVNVIKDIDSPVINIVFPIQFQKFNSAPQYNLNIIDPNLDTIWYTINGTMNKFIINSSIGDINEEVWVSLDDGIVLLGFFANDSLGNIGSNEISVEKDTILPKLIIHSPINNTEYGQKAPFFNISIIEKNLKSVWYSLDGGFTNHTIISFTGFINQSVWDTIPNGPIIILFFAEDSAGNLNFQEIYTIKDVKKISDTIPSYDLFIILGIIPSLVFFVLMKQRKEKSI